MNIDWFISWIIIPLLCVSILLVFIRFLIGPNLSDRVISLDLIITIGIAIMAVYAILTKQEAFLDIATIFALIAFLGTVAFSYYIEKRGK